MTMTMMMTTGYSRSMDIYYRIESIVSKAQKKLDLECADLGWFSPSRQRDVCLDVKLTWIEDAIVDMVYILSAHGWYLA